MQDLDHNEDRLRGTYDFPFEFHHIDQAHPRYVMSYHWHVEYEIIRILEGSLTVTLDEKSFIATAGDIIFVHSGILHSGIPDNCLYQCIVFDGNVFLKNNSVCAGYMQKIIHQEILIYHHFTPKHIEICNTINSLFDSLWKREPGYELLEMAEDMPTAEIAARLEEQMAEGMHIVSVRKVEDGKAGKAMALVAAADYLVEFRPGKEPSIDWKGQVKEFLAQPEIKVTKQTKRSEKEIDLRPNIYKMEVRENGFFYMLASASSNYTKPEMVTNTFFHWLGEELPEFAFTVKRLEMYADEGENASPRFVTLESLGEEIE